MGNAVPRAAAAAAQQAYIDKPERHLTDDLRKLIVVERIGNSRFLKSYHCTEDGVAVCVKVYVKLEADEDLEAVRQGLIRLQRQLPRAQCLNVLPYVRAIYGRKRVGPRPFTPFVAVFLAGEK